MTSSGNEMTTIAFRTEELSNDRVSLYIIGAHPGGNDYRDNGGLPLANLLEIYKNMIINTPTSTLKSPLSLCALPRNIRPVYE